MGPASPRVCSSRASRRQSITAHGEGRAHAEVSSCLLSRLQGHRAARGLNRPSSKASLATHLRGATTPVPSSTGDSKITRHHTSCISGGGRRCNRFPGGRRSLPERHQQGSQHHAQRVMAGGIRVVAARRPSRQLVGSRRRAEAVALLLPAELLRQLRVLVIVGVPGHRC